MSEEPRALRPVASTPSASARPKLLLLRTKLLPPRPIPELLPRPRLIERLRATLGQPMTLVTANAGSGKTTLVAEFVRQHIPQFVWYQLDQTDSELTVFPAYLVEGIGKKIAGFGASTRSYLEQAADEISRYPERVADVLINEILEQVEQPFTLVLDDYHHLALDSPVHRMMDRLVSYAPEMLHLILISREMPPLNLTRLRSQSALTIIDRDEMLFTESETQELFRQVFDLELTADQLRQYGAYSNGWITALQLVRQVTQRHSVKGAGSPADLAEVLRQSERDIADYFAEEVFTAETAEAQELLLRVALLDQIELGVCAQLWPHLNVRKLLPTLERRNVFFTLVSDDSGEEYRLHPLFQGFLRRRFVTEQGRSSVAAEYERIADFMRARNSWVPGVRYLLQAEKYERAAAIIGQEGTAMIAAGALEVVTSLIEALPTSMLETNPRVMGLRGEVARLRGDYGAAQPLLRRAATLFQAQQDAVGEAEALHSLATIARRQGDMVRAVTYVERALSLSAPNSPIRVKCGNTRGLCSLAAGDLVEAEREFRLALQLAEELGDDHDARLIAHNLGLPAMIRGDFGGALRWLRRMLRDREDAVPVPRDAPAHLNIARCHFYQGRLAECEKHLQRALDCCQRFHLKALLGEIFEAYGNLQREAGNLQSASEYYQRATRAYEEAGIEVTQQELLEEQAILCWESGDLATALGLLDKLMVARSAGGNMAGVFSASLVRGRIRLAQGDAESATEELQTACAHFRQQGLNYYEAIACLALAACAFATHQEVAQVEHLRRAIELAIRYDYEYWLKREVMRNPQLFALPEAAELLPQDLHTLLKTLAPLKPTPRQESKVIVSQVVTDLTINLLGPVEIFRDPHRPFAADAWTTRRARDILCFIATRPHRRASKDTIVDTFWGESDFDATEKNFHPTISHIRKALNNNQLIKQNFLLYRDGDYLLNPEFEYRIDTVEFDRLFEQGDVARRAGKTEEQISAFEEVIALYRGDFMQNTYDDWTEELRGYYRDQYFRLLETLTLHAQKNEDWLRSIQLARKILKDDPYREDIHCLVMRAQAAVGKREAVKEQYQTLQRLLREELGVAPSAETKKLYAELLPL
ncbi:MAG TPA: tetratricopeptide repeat protein [Blastocatellia bacterium]|nr:tetratricopeptide repeat protein [Blastocatellia bacterium]